MRTKRHRNTGRGPLPLFMLLCCVCVSAHARTESGPAPERATEGEGDTQALATHVERSGETLTQSLGLDRSGSTAKDPATRAEVLEGWSPEDMARIQGLGLRPEINRIQFYDRPAMNRLREAWRAAKTEGLRIVHLGDSHVQSGVIHHELRSELWPELGNGGHGLLFPYSAAKTYAPRSYRSRHRGAWTYGKSWRLPAEVPLGVAGMSVRTHNPHASFTLTFKAPVPQDWRALRIYCERDRHSYDLKIDSGGRTTSVRVRPKGEDVRPYVEVTLPRIGRSVRVRMRRRSSRQRRFELHGMTLQSVNPGGLVVHNAGVGASRYRAILHEEHFESHLATLDPHLVIVEYGTNDYLYDDLIKPELEGEIRASIARIRRAAPEAQILLVSAQDLYRKSKNLASGLAYSDLLHRIASEEKTAVFDWYWIAGGGRTLRRWRDAGLARKDLIHLTSKGYRFKGRHLAQALRQTFEWMDQSPESERLVVDREPLKRALAALPSEEVLAAQAPPASTPPPLEGASTYRVRSGECLAGIAKRHGVSAQEIMRWNGMKSRRIYAGRELQLILVKE
jgi:LysM repeat protein